jgi:hypothetical protein
MTSSIDIPGKLRAKHGANTDISESVGGTIYATTPGGTKIVYRREELVHLSKSPLAQTRPLNMPELPGVTTATVGEESGQKAEHRHHSHHHGHGHHGHHGHHHHHHHQHKDKETPAKDNDSATLFEMDHDV